MDYSILAMDLDSLVESGEVIWALIGTLGATTIFSVLTFIKTISSGKKFNKVSDFTVVADQSIGFAKGEILKAKDQIVEETRKTIVEPMKAQVQALLSDNANLVSLSVSLLSYIPLPLEIKKDAVSVITTLGNISNEALKLFETSIAYQETQEAKAQEVNNDLSENIDDI